jgi:hypothetical protein
MQDGAWYTLNPKKIRNKRRMRIICSAVRELDQEVEVRFLVRYRLCDEATPEGGLRVKLGVELRYDTKVVGASFEGAKEGSVSSAACGDYCPVSENDFVGLDVVASKTITAREE